MPFPTDLEAIPGARDLYEWFGYWPSFHDAEVVGLHLNRMGSSLLAVHTWETTDQVNASGHYTMRKHVVVEFAMEDISGLELEGFNKQNVIFGLDIKKKENGFELAIDPCYGVSGKIVAGKLEIKALPGTEYAATTPLNWIDSA